MNLNTPAKFLCHQNGNEQINTEFSGIFNKSLLADNNVNHQNHNHHYDHETETTESSTTSTITENNEFLLPHSRNVQKSPSQKKEISLSDYFKSLQMLQNINEKHLKILKRITSISPSSGSVSMKISSQNKLENVIYYNSANSKFVNYNIIDPLSLGLIKDSESEQSNAPNQVSLKRKVGRPKKDDSKKLLNPLTTTAINKNELNGDLINHRTKKGRVVKFTPEVAKLLQVDQESLLASRNVSIPETNQIDMSNNITEVQQAAPRKQRKISSEFRCTTCKKVYLGRNKMNHHLKLHPDHRAFSNESDLFSHLMKLVRQKKNNQDMANVFFKELSSFVHTIEKLTPKLITNKEHPNVLHHNIDKNAASVLRINPGDYRINMNVFDRNFKFDMPNNHHEIEEELSINNSGHIEEEGNHQDIEKNHEAHGHEVIKVLDDVPSLDGNEVNLLIPQTELTNLTNISDIITNDANGDNALLEFLN